jgi:putative DNA primase/helicase
MGLKHALGDSGFKLWDYWSSKSAKYPGTQELERKWASFTADRGLTEATVFKMAMAAGWKPPRAKKPAPPAAGSAEGISTPSKGSARGDGEGEAERRKRPERPAWADALKNDRNGPADCRENVFLLLTQHPDLQGLVGWDEFAHRVMKLRQPPWDSPPGEWLPQDDYSLGLWLMQSIGMTIKSESTLVAGVGMAAWAARYHPVLQYLGDLPAWDGIERLPYWLSDCLGAEDSTYTRLIGTWFVMGMVQRVKNPGCQMDYMLVLEGLQGRRKSTALATLMPLREWFADTPMRLGDKDSMLSLAGKWLVEMGELASLSRAETEEIKQYVSSRVDRVREPFARRFVDRPRSCVFGGTTNQGEYFKDPTGARRFWPVHCSGVPECDGGVNLTKLAEWRDQLFAEAMARLANSDPEVARHHPTREESELYLQPEQEKREIADPWFERLAVWLNSTNKFGDSIDEVRDVDSFTSQELLTMCIGVPMDRIDGARQMSTRIGIAMHKLGWEKRRDTAPPRLWRYWRPAPAPSTSPAQAGAWVDDSTAGGPACEAQA